MPKYASFSDNCTAERCCFSRIGCGRGERCDWSRFWIAAAVVPGALLEETSLASRLEPWANFKNSSAIFCEVPFSPVWKRSFLLFLRCERQLFVLLRIKVVSFLLRTLQLLSLGTKLYHGIWSVIFCCSVAILIVVLLGIKDIVFGHSYLIEYASSML